MEPRTDAVAGSRVLVDFTDLLWWLSHFKTVSGIQRVLVEVLPHVDRREECVFVAYQPYGQDFVALDRRRVLRLLDVVQNQDNVNLIRLEVEELLASMANRSTVEVHPGDVLAVLGAGWVYPQFFLAVSRLKRRGARVVVLLYDLIPVVVPGSMPTALASEFRYYVARVGAFSDRAPAISAATRRDFENYTRIRNWRTPPGGVTGLAGDQWDAMRLASMGTPKRRAWDRPYVLFVSTVEGRKNHILALRAWQRLLAVHDGNDVPDLVCVGRMGWNVVEFLEEYEATSGAGGFVHLITDSISDAKLAALYRDCEFTIYPSRYEGWGLPVAESLQFGKPVVATRASSLPEVGQDFAVYFENDDLEGFTQAINRYITEQEALLQDAERIRNGYVAPSWETIAAGLSAEFEAARHEPNWEPAQVELNTEYGIDPIEQFPGTTDDAEAVLGFLRNVRKLPITGQVMGINRALVVESTVEHVHRQAGPGVQVHLVRPGGGDLFLVVAIKEGIGKVSLTLSSPGGDHIDVTARRGRVVTLPLGAGEPGESIHATITARGSSRSVPVRSFVLLDSSESAMSFETAHVAVGAWRSGPSRSLARLASRAETVGAFRRDLGRLRRRLPRLRASR